MKRYIGVSIWGALWRGFLSWAFPTWAKYRMGPFFSTKPDPEPRPFKAGEDFKGPFFYPDLEKEPSEITATYTPANTAGSISDFLAHVPGFRVNVQTPSGKARVIGIEDVNASKGTVTLKIDGGSYNG